MNNEENVYLAILLGIIVLVALGFGYRLGITATDDKLDECITLAQYVTPDPNDTEARSNFIKQCYQKDNEDSKAKN